MGGWPILSSSKSRPPPCRTERDKGGAPALVSPWGPVGAGDGFLARSLQKSEERGTGYLWDLRCAVGRGVRVIPSLGVPHPCRGFCDRVGNLTVAAIRTSTPARSLFRAVHCDSISTGPSTPVA